MSKMRELKNSQKNKDEEPKIDSALVNHLRLIRRVVKLESRVIKYYLDDLMAEGFSRKEAMQIITAIEPIYLVEHLLSEEENPYQVANDA